MIIASSDTRSEHTASGAVQHTTSITTVGWSVQYDGTAMVDEVMRSSDVHNTYTSSVTGNIAISSSLSPAVDRYPPSSDVGIPYITPVPTARPAPTEPWSSHVVHLPPDPAAPVSDVAIAGTDCTRDPHPTPSDEDYTTSRDAVTTTI